MDTASRSPYAEQPPLAAYIEQQVETRLRKLAYELRHTRQSMNQERVHDLRVALRRLMETLRAAKGVLPKEGVAEVLGSLRKIMNDAGRVRSCDIAAELLGGAGVPTDAGILTELAARRALAERRLYDRAQHAYRRDSTAKWRTALLHRAGLPPPGGAV